MRTFDWQAVLSIVAVIFAAAYFLYLVVRRQRPSAEDCDTCAPVAKKHKKPKEREQDAVRQ